MKGCEGRKLKLRYRKSWTEDEDESQTEDLAKTSELEMYSVFMVARNK